MSSTLRINLCNLRYVSITSMEVLYETVFGLRCIGWPELSFGTGRGHIGIGAQRKGAYHSFTRFFIGCSLLTQYDNCVVSIVLRIHVTWK